MFGVLAGVRSISAVCATFAARFLPTASTFQVSNNVVRPMLHGNGSGYVEAEA